MQCVTDSTARKLVRDQGVAHQFLIQRFRHLIIQNIGFTGRQPVAGNKILINTRFDIDHRLVNAGDVRGTGF
ncbi:hypothetical protein SRABI106_04501 [Rahnella aquatilis]|nr:hypothetical protein SRABI106_04501 [Rahnella aquatilis]